MIRDGSQCITGRDCFWDGSVPNPLEVSVSSLTMSVSSNIPEPSGAGARVGDLADPVPSRPKVGGITVISYHNHTDMVRLLTDTSKGLGTDPSQKQSRPVILTAS
jgi:hypothetical protein